MRVNRLGLPIAAVILASVALLGFGSPPVQYDVSSKPVTKAASTDGVSFTVDTSKLYTLYHTGKNTSAAAATGLVVVGYDAETTAADFTEDTNKLILESGGVVLIDRGPATIHIKSASGAPVIQIIPHVRVR